LSTHFSKTIEKTLKEEQKCQGVHLQAILKKLKAFQISIHNLNIKGRNQEVCELLICLTFQQNNNMIFMFKAEGESSKNVQSSKYLAKKSEVLS